MPHGLFFKGEPKQKISIPAKAYWKTNQSGVKCNRVQFSEPMLFIVQSLIEGHPDRQVIQKGKEKKFSKRNCSHHVSSCLAPTLLLGSQINVDKVIKSKQGQIKNGDAIFLVCSEPKAFPYGLFRS